MNQSLVDYSRTRYEMQNLFRARLNQEQIHYISIIIKILAKYMVLDRDMIQLRSEKKIGLSYIINSVNHGLITELKYRDDKEEKDIFHFHLNTAGVDFAKTENLLLNRLPLSADHYVKSRIVTFNKWALENGHDLVNSRKVLSNDFSYFFTIQQGLSKQNICFFENITNEQILSQKILKNANTRLLENQAPYTIEEIFDKYTFIKISHPIINIGNKSCAPIRSQIE